MPSKQCATRISLADATKIVVSHIAGIKLFKHVRVLLRTLHHVSGSRDTAGSRKLQFDQYGALMLIFNPVIDSLHGLQQASKLKEIQREFEVSRSSLGSLSKSVTIFIPEAIK